MKYLKTIVFFIVVTLFFVFGDPLPNSQAASKKVNQEMSNAGAFEKGASRYLKTLESMVLLPLELFPNLNMSDIESRAFKKPENEGQIEKFVVWYKTGAYLETLGFGPENTVLKYTAHSIISIALFTIQIFTLAFILLQLAFFLILPKKQGIIAEKHSSKK